MKIKPIWFALILGGFAFVSLTLLVYAFMQKKEAERQASIAVENEMRIIECERISIEREEQLNRSNEELTKLNERIKLQFKEAEENITKAQKAAEQAAKFKNKK